MKKKMEYVLIMGDQQVYFWAEDDFQAEDILTRGLKRVQDICEHESFKNGKCENCDIECDHAENDDNVCLDCGQVLQPAEPEREEWEER